MKVGDVVRCVWPDSFSYLKEQSGIILEINQCSQSTIVDVRVLWSNGKVESFDESELDIIEVVDGSR